MQDLAALLPAALDAIVVADNPQHTRGSALACAALLAAAGRQPVLSLATRDRNRVALESDVLGARRLGVRGFLCLSGDHQSLGISPQAAAAYDVDSIQFAAALHRIAADGVGFDGQKTVGSGEMLIGAVAHPYLRPLELNLIRLAKKIAAGTQFLLTQAVFDIAGFTEWMDAVRARKLHEKAAIIVSVLPLTSVEHAKARQARPTYGPVGEEVVQRLQKAADPAAEGLAIPAWRPSPSSARSTACAAFTSSAAAARPRRARSSRRRAWRRPEEPGTGNQEKTNTRKSNNPGSAVPGL